MAKENIQPVGVPDPDEQVVAVPEGTAAPAAPFHSFVFDDGQGNREEMSWKDKPEMDNYLRRNHMSNRKYTQGMQGLGDATRKLGEREKTFSQRESELNASKRKYDDFNQFLNEKPEVEKYIMQNMRQPTSDNILEQGRGYVDEKTQELEKEMQGFRDWKSQQESQAKRTSAFSQLKELYPDFDEKAVSKDLDNLFQSPEGDEIRSLAEVAYFAAKGRTAPAAIEQGLSDDILRKQNTKSLPSASAEVSAGGKQQFADEAEAAAQAKADLGAK